MCSDFRKSCYIRTKFNGDVGYVTLRQNLMVMLAMKESQMNKSKIANEYFMFLLALTIFHRTVLFNYQFLPSNVFLLVVLGLF